jgi:hypothetical protein
MNNWLEKELEDYIVANPDSLRHLLYYGADDKEERIDVLGRQVRCDAGIIDILLWVHSPYHHFVWVVECKAVHETGRVVEQVQRYVDAVKHAEYEFEYFDGELYVSPLIIAPSFSKQFAETYNHKLVKAQKTDYGFELSTANDYRKQGNSHLLDVLRPAIERSSLDAKTEEIKSKLRRNGNKRFCYQYLCN